MKDGLLRLLVDDEKGLDMGKVDSGAVAGNSGLTKVRTCEGQYESMILRDSRQYKCTPGKQGKLCIVLSEMSLVCVLWMVSLVSAGSFRTCSWPGV